jgi:hypothetical protein
MPRLGRASGIASLLCGVIGGVVGPLPAAWVLAKAWVPPLILGPFAVVLGFVGVAKGYRLAWIGLLLGVAQVVAVAAFIIDAYSYWAS